MRRLKESGTEPPQIELLPHVKWQRVEISLLLPQPFLVVNPSEVVQVALELFLQISLDFPCGWVE